MINFIVHLKELFDGLNIDSMKEALPKVSIYNNIIVKFIEEINSKYGMALTFTTLESHEVGHWAKTIQVACGIAKNPKSYKENHSSVQPQPIQDLQTVTEQPQVVPQPVTGQHLTPPSVQIQEEEINRLTIVATQWSAGDQQRVENNYSAHRYWYTCNCSMPNMSQFVPDYSDCIH